MTENGIFRYALLQGPLKRVDVVDALAHKGAFIKQVLIDIGHGKGIGIQPIGPGKSPLKQRAFRADRQRRRDTGLQNSVTMGDAAFCVVKIGQVERVGHFAYQAFGGASGKPGIGIDSDDVADIPGDLRSGDAAVEKTGVLRAAQQAVQFVQFAALALPSHPGALGDVPQPLAVQQHEQRRSIARITLVQFRNTRTGAFQQRLVGRRRLALAVGPVGQQNKGQPCVRVGKIMDFEPRDLFGDGVLAHQQNRDDQQGLAGLRHAVLQPQRGQAFWTPPVCHGTIDDRDRQIRGRQDRKQTQRHTQGGIDARQGDGDKARRGQHNEAQVAHQPGSGRCAPEFLRKGRPIADAFFEILSGATDQIVPRVILAWDLG